LNEADRTRVERLADELEAEALAAEIQAGVTIPASEPSLRADRPPPPDLPPEAPSDPDAKTKR